MKIGFFTDSYFPEIDGVTYTIKCWREELEREGHEVYVVYPDGDYTPGEREIPVPSLPNPFYAGYRIPLATRPSRLPDLDVVHCHGPASVGLLGRYYARKHDLPAVYTHHTPIEEYFHQSIGSERVASLLSRLYVPWENTLLDSFDVVTASTDRIDRDVDHVRLPVGIDMAFFRPSTEEWYDDTDRPMIGYSGRLSMEKNVSEILRLAEIRPEYEFVIVGEGPYRDRLEREAPENVTIREFLPREELPIFYSSIDVFVTASTADTLGLSTLEANACGTPVVAADVPPFDRTISPENGERFAYGDLDSMADAVDACLRTDRNTRAAVERYDIRYTLSQLERLYREVRDAADGVTTTFDDEWHPAGRSRHSADDSTQSADDPLQSADERSRSTGETEQSAAESDDSVDEPSRSASEAEQSAEGADQSAEEPRHSTEGPARSGGDSRQSVGEPRRSAEGPSRPTGELRHPPDDPHQSADEAARSSDDSRQSADGTPRSADESDGSSDESRRSVD